LSIQPLELKLESFQALYQCQAQGQDGFLDRVPMIWKMILEPDFTQSVFAYGFGGGFGGDLSDCAVPLPHQSPYQGYVIFKQVKEEEGSAVQVLDWVLLTPDAVQTFWALMANHRSMIDRVQWCSGAIDDLSVLLPEQTARLQSCQRWLARIIHLPTALADRGYPLGQWQLHLWVEDERLPGNAGNWLLSVDQGQAQVTPGGRGELRLRIETLVTLYTGLFSPYQLQRLGLLEAEAGVLAIAQQIFPLSSPWTPDFF
jgi:predicted acetyltransferase